MSHRMTARASSSHDDIEQHMMSAAPVSCRPGVDIEVTYHPGWEKAAAEALRAAYLDVAAQIDGMNIEGKSK